MLFILPAVASPWTQVFLVDLEAAVDLLEENHPGPVMDPDFRSTLAKAEQVARSELVEVTDFEAGVRVLTRFGNAFHDGHLNIRFSLQPGTTRWPGFLTRLQGENVVVTGSKRSFPKNGMVVESCDGRSALSWLDDDVIPNTRGLPGTQAGRLHAASFWFLSDTLDTPPHRCSFDGQIQEVAFNAETATSTMRNRAWTAMSPNSAPTGLAIEGKTVWLSLPTFQPGHNQEKTLNTMIAELASHRSAERIVFDVRGNGGGSSIWGQRLVEALWGDRTDQLWHAPLPMPDEPTTVTWRASEGNLAYFEGMRTELSNRDARSKAWITNVLDGLSKAVESGDELWIQPGSKETRKSRRTAPNPVGAEVFFLTDGFCASACLDFADLILGMPGVQHVGYQTSADTRYMEVRTVVLPSGAARLTFAQKAYTHRMRGHNVPYTPPVPYTGDGSHADLATHFDTFQRTTSD